MSPQRRCRSIGGGLVLLAALVVVQTASAGGIAIRQVDARDYPTIRLTIVTPTASSRAPALTENGQAVAGLQAENLGREQSIVLALDHSQSMYGRPLADAIAAARTFVEAKPDPDQIAVVSVASEALGLSDFASSTSDAEGALSAISTDPVYGTALYDAVVLAAHKLRDHGLPGRVVILVTDGQETTSKSTLAQAIEAARAAGAAVYAVAIPSGAFSPRPLRQLAEQTGGRFIVAPSTKALKGIYGAIAAELARTWRLQYLTAARPGDRLRLEASAGRARAVVSERLPGRGAAAPRAGASAALILALVVGAALLAAMALAFLRSALSLPRWRSGSSDF